MPKRRDNMLEAFRESSRLEKVPTPPRAGEALPFPDARAGRPAEVEDPEPAPAPEAEAAEAPAEETAAAAEE